MFRHPPRKCDKYVLQNLAYSSTYTCVYEAFIKGDRQKVILKFIYINSETSKLAENEYQIQCSIHHPFIMSAIHSQIKISNDEYCILQMPPGICSLASIHCIDKVKKIKNIHTIYKIMYQMLLGISFLHDLRILHGDIKPENFVLMKEDEINPEIRIIDFGHSVRFKEEDMTKCLISMTSGTTIYNPPEILIGQPHSFPADIWSLGASFYFLITGEWVLQLNNKPAMYNESKSIFLKYDKKFGPQFPKSGKDLIISMLNFNPEKRPTAITCLNNPFFTEFLDPEWIDVQHMIISQQLNDNALIQEPIDKIKIPGENGPTIS